MRAPREVIADVRRAAPKIFREMLFALTDEAAVAHGDRLRVALKTLHGFTSVRSTPSLPATRVP
jgi:hypothetical protein